MNTEAPQRCRLCLNEAPLCNSHIIPEWCFKCIYDETHHALHIVPDPDEPTIKIQKGLRERLLCSRCEGQFATYEKYVREIIFGGTELLISQQDNALHINECDYEKLKLFQLSILWRAGIANGKDFENVNLGPHEEIIHKMLFDRRPGLSTDYGCMMSLLLDDDGQLFKGIIVAPEKIKKHGFYCYRFIFSGCGWIFVVSSKSENFEEKDRFLKEDGTLILPLIPARKTELFQGMGRKLRAAGKIK